MSLSLRGSRISFPMNRDILSSVGFTATAVSPSMVSGLVVAIVKEPELSANGYSISTRTPVISLYLTSSSDNTVAHRGHQLVILSPWYIKLSL